MNQHSILKYFFISLFFLSACSTTPKFIPQESPQPLPIPSNDVPKPTANSLLLPYPMTPENKKTSNSDFSLPASTGASAAYTAAVYGAIVGVAQIFSAPKPNFDLNGTCIYGSPEDPVSVSPCINVQVHLFKKSNEILASTSTNQRGDFRFFIPKGESYFIQVTDRKGRSASTGKEVGRSEVISIFLKP